jgi:hypothetical protein
MDWKSKVQFPKEIFLYSTACRLALGLIQPIQWIAGGFCPRVKGPRHEADHSTPSSAEDKNGEASFLQQFIIRKEKTWVKMEKMWTEAITA